MVYFILIDANESRPNAIDDYDGGHASALIARCFLSMAGISRIFCAISFMKLNMSPA